MKLLELTLSSPEENLACDEALLELAENGLDQQCLRFWESSSHFAVLGYSNKAAVEIHHLKACEQDQIPVLRRPSGGGTVLQGPGCLNYALVLRMDSHPSFGNLTQTNATILEKHRAALEPELSNLKVQGISDLTWNDFKFSGNAQRRKKHFLLFHGTFLYDFDLSLISKYLKHPPRQPAYRQNRPHGSFITNISLSGKKIREILQETWNISGEIPPPQDEINKLVKEKYSRRDWNLKF